MSTISSEELRALEEKLSGDTRVKVAGVDVDGILRGKIMSRTKFMSAVKHGGFGFCSVAFGWDMHDRTYDTPSVISNSDNGFEDIEARIDLDSFRRIPWEDNQAFFLLKFYHSDGRRLPPDPRGLLESKLEQLAEEGHVAIAGLELEFFNYLETPSTIAKKAGHGLVPLTPGNFGYSILRPNAAQSKSYFTSIYDTALKFDCPIEGWHTETGPGVYEAALEFSDAKTIADRGLLFKYLCKALGAEHGITPCFMAKPSASLAGTSGHLHLSLVDQKTGNNLFAREEADQDAPYKDLRNFSQLGQYFLAGILEGLPDIMPLLAPTINSYKRLVENYWAPVDVSWGLEHRLASVRLIAPPTCSPKSTRIEVRVPGADVVPHYALAALIGLGFRGIQKKLAIPIPPLNDSSPTADNSRKSQRLAKDLRQATELFMRPESLAREVLGDAFVEHYGMTRLHEVRLYETAVTDWEVVRYMETV